MKSIYYTIIGIFGFGLLLYFYTQIGGEDDVLDKLTISTEKNSAVSNDQGKPEKALCETFYSSLDDHFSERFIEEIKLEFLIDHRLADFILYTAEVEIIKGRKTFGLMQALDTDKPKYYLGAAERASNQNEKSILTWIINGNVEALVNSIYESDIISDEYYRYKGKSVFIIELILLSNVSHKEEVIRKLLSAGIEPNFSDFIAAIKKGTSVELINEMVTASNIDPRKELNHNFHLRSLVTYAIYEQKYELFKYLIKEGSPAEPDLYVENSLDLLSFRNNKFTQSQLDDIYVTLINYGVYPNKESSYSRLTKVLSDTTLQNHPLPKRDILYGVEVDALKERERELYLKIMEELDRLKTYELSNSDCFRDYGRELVKSFVDSQIEPVKSLNYQLTSANLDLDKRVVEASRFVSNERELLNYLGGNQTLFDKKVVDYYLRKKAVIELDSAIKNASLDPAIPRLQDELEEVYKLAKNGEWNKARALLATLDIDKKEALSTLLMFALNLRAESRIARELLEDGAYFESALIYAVINTGDVSLAQVFYEYGLDINYIDPSHNTPIILAAKLQKFDMMKWLVSKGSKVNSDNLGFDAMDVVLSSNMDMRRKTSFLTLLINNGALVETSHKQIVNGLFNSNLQEYYHIVNKFPVFRDA